MAAPFYNPADQAIYEGGQHFIPQEQYRLNYTAPAIMGQNTNAGIAATGAANPYKWPYPEGGGEYDQGISGTQVTYKRPLGLSPGALSGGLDEAKLPGFGNWAKRTLGGVQDLYSKLPTPTNLLMKGIRHWKEKRDIRREENLQAEIAAHNQAAAAQAAHESRAASTPGYGADPGGRQSVDTSGARGPVGKEMMAQGGKNWLSKWRICR